VNVDFATGENKSAAHLKRQPFGKVPVAEDNGFSFYESRAICRYLVDKYASDSKIPLIPSDIKERAIFEQWMSLESTTYTPEITALLKESSFALKHRGGKKNEAAAAAASANLKRDGQVLNEQLGKHQYVAGDNFTLVDICLPTYMWYIRDEPELKQWFADFPNIAAWFKRVTVRPAFQQVLEIIGGKK